MPGIIAKSVADAIAKLKEIQKELKKKKKPNAQASAAQIKTLAAEATSALAPVLGLNPTAPDIEDTLKP